MGDFSKWEMRVERLLGGLLTYKEKLKILTQYDRLCKNGIFGRKYLILLKAYFAKYQKADNVINDIVHISGKGQNHFKE